MSDNPRFSILIPTYNYGRFVGRAVDSALSQSGNDYEVLVLDDGSTDDTPGVMQQYDNGVRYYRHANCGAATTRNRGAKLACGEWLLFLDADDRLLPDALSHFRSAISENPASRLLFGHHVSIAESGREREAKPQPSMRDSLTNFRDYLDRKFGIAHGTVILHRDVFQKLQYPEGITNGEDIVLFAQALALFPSASFPHATAAIHAHDGRMRNNIATIIATGMQTVAALFRPDLLPPKAMQYQRLFAARRFLSLARSLFKAKRYSDAREIYGQAVRADWTRALTPTNIGRYLQCVLRSLPFGKNGAEKTAERSPRLVPKS